MNNYVTQCTVKKYLTNAVKVKMADGQICILPSSEISDALIPIDKKVYPGQKLTVSVSFDEATGKPNLHHKELMKSKEDFLKENAGSMVKGRVIFCTHTGCLLELDSNVHYFVKHICNLQSGLWVWASITKSKKVLVDSVLYDEEKCFYPQYRYILPHNENHEIETAAA